MRRVVLSVGLAGFAVMVVACGGGTPKPDRGSTEQGAPAAATEGDQRERAGLIAEWTRAGYFREVRAEGKAVRLVVTAAFLALDFDEKQTMVSVVAAHHYRVAKGENVRPGEDVFVDDVRTGLAVGLFSSSGLILN